MKQIRRLITGLAVLLAPVLISCEQEDPSIDFDTTTIEMKADGGSQSVSLTTNYDWSATASDSWLQVSPASGKKGTAVLTIRADDTTILDYIKYAVRYFIAQQQEYQWR